MKATTIIFGIVCGGFVGLVIGVLAAFGLGYWSKWSNPHDASAGSVAIVVILTAPFGAMTGAALGAVTIIKRRRLFFATFFPLAILFIGVWSTLSTLRAMDRPRNFALEINGSPGAEYFGIITVDGETQSVKGVLPAKFEFESHRVDLAVALVSRKGNQNIAVNLSADGNDLRTGTESQTGVHLQMESFGYSETFGGTSRVWHRMSPEEVDRLIHDQLMPRNMLEH